MPSHRRRFLSDDALRPGLTLWWPHDKVRPRASFKELMRLFAFTVLGGDASVDEGLGRVTCSRDTKELQKHSRSTPRAASRPPPTLDQLLETVLQLVR